MELTIFVLVRLLFFSTCIDGKAFSLGRDVYKRQELISNIMKKQYAMVREQIPDAVFCTNLYGEILELYREAVSYTHLDVYKRQHW